MKQKDTSGKEEIATYVTKKTKNISLKQVALQTTVTIEKEADIDQFLQSIKTRLLKELSEDKDTVIQLLM